MYSVVRYVADPIRNEPVNIGLVVHSANKRFIRFRFDEKRVNIADPDRDTLKHYEQELLPIKDHEIRWEDALFETIPVSDPMFLSKVSDYIGNKITFDTPRGCRTDDLSRTFEELFNQFVTVHNAVVATRR